jgi:hypothetical protein
MFRFVQILHARKVLCPHMVQTPILKKQINLSSFAFSSTNKRKLILFFRIHEPAVLREDLAKQLFFALEADKMLGRNKTGIKSSEILARHATRTLASAPSRVSSQVRDSLVSFLYLPPLASYPRDLHRNILACMKATCAMLAPGWVVFAFGR